MPRVVHFEINADDPERARTFYERVFGWRIDKYKGPVDYWLVTTGEKEVGINGGIMRRTEPGAGTWNTVEVPALEEYIEKVQQAGGRQITEKMAVPGVGWFAYCQDTEGNTFGLMQADPLAR